MRGVRVALLSFLLVLVLRLWTGVGQVRLIGLYVVPTDYATINAALSAASDAGGGTIVVLDRPAGADRQHDHRRGARGDRAGGQP